MCVTCGCGGGAKVTLTRVETGRRSSTRDAGGFDHGHSQGPGDHVHAHGADHVHAHGADHVHAHEDSHETDHGHAHGHPHAEVHSPAPATVTLELEARVLAKNDALAARNRSWFAGREILALNLVSSPGAGKTTILERTIRALEGRRPLYVVEGDQATSKDGERIRSAGAAVVQLNTGSGCHLEADMVAKALAALRPPVGSLVVIENVGNLVCPALFDLGERTKVVVLSVAEGDDKPLKYPHMFRAAGLLLLNKVDLLPYVDFDVDKAIANARAVNPRIEILRVSARTGEGLDAWYAWLEAGLAAARDVALLGGT